MTKRVRAAFQYDWRPPLNADFVHYGALRGLDFAKQHFAAISIGRMELPSRALNGFAAALGYDDEDPAQTSAAGNGSERAFEKRILQMRDGRDISMTIPVDPGYWAAKVQEQFREEELKQFVGRLRPVYREGIPPVWYAMTVTLPTDIIWDKITTSTELITTLLDGDRVPRNLGEISRRCDGLLSPEIAIERCGEIANEKLMRPTFEFDGIDLREKKESPGVIANWSRLRWRDGTGRWNLAWASPWITDAPTRLQEALALHHYDVRDVELERAIPPSGSAKVPDALDTMLGSPDARGDREDEKRRQLKRGIHADDTGGIVSVGEIGLERRRTFHGVEKVASLEAQLARLAIAQGGKMQIDDTSATF